MENGAEGSSTAVKYKDTVVEPKKGQLMNLQSCSPGNDNAFSMASPLTGLSGSVDEEIHSEDAVSSKSECENSIPGEFTSPPAGFPQLDKTFEVPDWSLPPPERDQSNEGVAAHLDHSGAKPKNGRLHVMNLQSCSPAGNDNAFSMASPLTGLSGSVDEEIQSEDAVSLKSECENTNPREFTSPPPGFPQLDKTFEVPDWSLPPPERSGQRSEGVAAHLDHSGSKPKNGQLHVMNLQSCSPGNGNAFSMASPLTGLSGSVDEEIHSEDAVSSMPQFKNTCIPKQHLSENVFAREFTSPSAGFPQVDNTCTYEWPEWSLPPPERRQRNESLAAYPDHSGAKSKKGQLHVMNLALQSCTFGNGNAFSVASPLTSFSGSVDEEIHSKDGMDVSAPESRSASASETTPHKDITCMKQSEQDSNTPPASQEDRKDGQVSINATHSLVTGPPLLISSVDVVACNSSSENLSSQQSRTPIEHDEGIGDNIGFLEVLTKKIERLHLKDTILILMQENEMLHRNAAYLVQKEREGDDQLRAKCMEIHSLRQQLQSARTVNEEKSVLINNLERRKLELEDQVTELEIFIIDRNETIRMQQEECERLRQECEELRQRVRLPIPEDDD